MVAVEAETGHDVVGGQRGSYEGGRLGALHIHLFVPVTFLRDLTDDVEVLPLFHLLVERSIDLHRNPPRQFLLHAFIRGSEFCLKKKRGDLHCSLQLRVSVFLQYGIVDGCFGQLVLVRHTLRFLYDDGRYFAQAVTPQTISPRGRS